jgi:outer membrane protein insertion porin family
MRSRLLRPIALAIAYGVSCHFPTHAQIGASATVSEGQNRGICPTSALADYKQPSVPQVTIAELAFDGDLHMPTADLEQISASLKQRTYSGNLDEVTSEALDRVKGAWWDRGYVKAQAQGKVTVLTSGPLSKRIAVAVRVEEGQQYRLGEITFKNNRAISNTQALRDQFSLTDGDVFDRPAVSKGLDNLRFAYGQLGYINFTSVSNIRFNEEQQTISIDVDLDEGKQFYISGINFLGLDEPSSQNLLKDLLLLRRGNVYNQRLVNLAFKAQPSLVPTDTTPESRVRLQLDERAATVGITLDFRPCPVE